MKYCEHCGSEVLDDARYCQCCGFDVSQPKDLTKTEEEPVNAIQVVEEQTEKGEYKMPNNDEETIQNEQTQQSNSYQQQNSYQQPNNTYVYTNVVPQKTNGMCIAGFVCSFFIPLLGLIFSIVGVSQANSHNEGGKGLGVAGIVISAVALVIALLLILPMGCVGCMGGI